MNFLSKNILSTLFISILSASPVFAKHTGNTTPTKYLLSISQVSFHKAGDPASTFIPYATGTGQYDIASVSPNANVGVLQATGTLSQGTYDQVQLTVNKTMTLQASNPSLTDSLPCRTTSTVTVITDPFGDKSLDKAYLGSRDGGTAQPETVTVPSGSKVKLPDSMKDNGSTFTGTLPVNFTVSSANPTITIKFDVTNAITLQALNVSTCIVFPGPPSITIVSS